MIERRCGCALAVLALALLGAGGTDAGVDALSSGRFEAAREQFERAAAAGDARAMGLLGELHYQGWGVSASHEDARRWYARAAERDDPGGLYGMARLYLLGHGVARDLSTALRWFGRAAGAGYVDLEAETYGTFCVPPMTRQRLARVLRDFDDGNPHLPGGYLHTRDLRALFPCR